MELSHCIYSSRSTDSELSSQALAAILEQSRINNHKLNITGILLFDSGTFFQVLEGDRAIIEKVYDHITKDSRHDQVVKLICEPIEERNFGEWSMGYPKVTKKELQNIDGLNDFFTQGNSFVDLEAGRAKTLLAAFKKGKWHY